MLTLRYGGGTIGVVETGYVTMASPFTIEVHGTQGSLLYSEPGIGQRVTRPSERPQPSPESDGHAGPDGRLRIWSATGTAGQWQVHDVTSDSRPTAFKQWVAHIQQGTRATENIALGTDLSAVIEAAYRSGTTGQVVPTSALEHANTTEAR